MIWITLFIFGVLLIPNLYKLCTVSVQLFAFMPSYLQSVTAEPKILEDDNTRLRLQKAFEKIFISIQTHALNVVAILLFGWVMWHRNEFAPELWLQIIISIVSIVACLSTSLVSQHLISEYRHVREGSQVLENARSSLGDKTSMPDSSLSLSFHIHIWAAISMYLASGFVSLCLLITIWL